MRRIGVLTNLSSDDPAEQSRVLAFAQRLAQSGWTEGRNVRTDIRWGVTDPERVRRAGGRNLSGCDFLDLHSVKVDFNPHV